jgi:hypothetical protein
MQVSRNSERWQRNDETRTIRETCDPRHRLAARPRVTLDEREVSHGPTILDAAIWDGAGWWPMG